MIICTMIVLLPMKKILQLALFSVCVFGFWQTSHGMVDIMLNQNYSIDGSVQINGEIRLSPIVSMLQGVSMTDENGNKISPLGDLCAKRSGGVLNASGPSAFIVSGEAAKSSWQCQKISNQ